MPASDDAQLLTLYAGKGVLLDSNLLLLLVVGTFDRSRVGTFKRLVMFAPEDLDTLLAIIARFRHVYITPNTVTEVSNLAGALSGEAKVACFRLFARMIVAAEEMLVSSKNAAAQAVFESMGVTDAVIFTVAGNPPLILTVDFALSQMLAARGLPVINFNHLRYKYWS